MRKKGKRGLLFGLLAGILIVSGCGAAKSSSDNAAGYWETGSYSEDINFEVGSESAGETDASAGELLSESMEAKIIRTCSITLETTEFEEAIGSAQARAAALGGYIEASTVSAQNRARRSASMTVRVPAQKLDEWRSGIEEAGTITYSEENSRNVTLEYVDLDSHVTALRTEQEALLGMLEKADQMEDIIAIQSQLTSVRYEIESYESQLRVLQDMVNYSTVYLSIREVERESSQDSGFFGEAFGRLGDTVYEMGQGLRSLGIFLIGELPVLVLLAALITVIVCAVRARRRKRKARVSGKDTGAVRVDENTVQIGEEPKE